MSKVNVAVVGYGHLGKWHTQKSSQLENSNLVAIVEPYEKNQIAAKETYPGVIVTGSLDDVLDKVEAVIIVTPTSTHHELVKKCLSAGKHVFCEKPLCSTMEEVLDLEPLVKEQIVQVGHSERCHQAWELLSSKFNELTGKKTIRIERYAPFKGRATDVDVVQDLMIHDIDLMLYLFQQKPVSVTSIGHKIRTDKWDHVTSHFVLESGDEVIIISGRNHVKEVRSLEAMGEHGCLYVDLFKNEILTGTNTEFEEGGYVKTEPYEKRDHLLLEQEAFFNSIQNKSKPMVSFEDGKNAVYLVSKVLESLEKSGNITL